MMLATAGARRPAAVFLAVALGVLVAGSPVAGAAPASQADPITRLHGLSFSDPVVVDPTFGGMSDISCTSPTSCVAVDRNGSGFVLTGDTWSGPQRFEELTLYGGQEVEAVSCATTSFCVAVDTLGQAFTFDGTAWSGAVQVDDRVLLDVSCPTATLCVAGDAAGRVVTFDDAAWSAPNPVNQPDWPIEAVSCTSASFCEALAYNGTDNGITAPYTSFTYDGQSWTQAAGRAPPGSEAISCASPTFCLAANHQSSATYDGGAWTAPAEISTGIPTEDVSCASSSFCVLVTSQGEAFVFDGNTWSPPQQANPGEALTAFSCISDRHCVAVGAVDAVTYDSGASVAISIQVASSSIDSGR